MEKSKATYSKTATLQKTAYHERSADNRLCNLMFKRLRHSTRKMGPYFTSWTPPPGPYGALVVLSHPHFYLPNRPLNHPKSIRYRIGKPLDIANFLPSKARSPKRSIGLTPYKSTLFPNTYYAASISAKYRNFPCKYLLLTRKLGIILMDDLHHSGT